MADSKCLDGFASMAGESPFSTITPQPPPNDPTIKKLLSRALMQPEGLSPDEVQKIAASLVYHLLSQAKT